MAGNKAKILAVLIGLGLYLLATGAGFTAFSFFQPGVKKTAIKNKQTAKFKVPTQKYAGLPKTETCPLSGALYPKPQRTDWEKRRPLGIMIENSQEARPQSGLSSADVVYEAMAEGGVSRLLAIFYCQEAEIVGPVRSARTYFLDWTSEYGHSPLYAHVGGANAPGPADALGQIEDYGWAAYNDLNQFSIGFPTFWRDYERLGKDTATEHTVYASAGKLWAFAAEKRELTDKEKDERTGEDILWSESFIPWKFKDDQPLAGRPEKLAASFNLSGMETSYADYYVVTWQYDRDSNSFLRSNGGAAHLDLNTGQQLTAKNVVLLFTTIDVADDDYNEEGHGQHLLYGTAGRGRARFLIDGKVLEGTWQKKNRLDRTRFYDSNGGEIKFNRGQVWIEVLPIGQPVTIAPTGG